MTLNSLDNPRIYLTMEFFITTENYLDTWQVQPVYWIVVEKICYLVCMTEIFSCLDYERTRVKAISMTYQVSLLYPIFRACALLQIQ